MIFIVYGVPGVVCYDGVHPMLAGWWNQGTPVIVIPELYLREKQTRGASVVSDIMFYILS